MSTPLIKVTVEFLYSIEPLNIECLSRDLAKSGYNNNRGYTVINRLMV